MRQTVMLLCAQHDGNRVTLVVIVCKTTHSFVRRRGLSENDGRGNDVSSKLQDVKLPDWAK